MQIVGNDKRGLLERNNSFVNRRDMKLAREFPTGMKECTFKPKVLKQAKPKEDRGDIVERLHSYLKYYEKRKEEYKNKLSQ